MVTIISKPSNGGGSGASTSKVKVSAVDTTEGYLASKLVAGTDISLTASGAGNETLTVAYTGGGGAPGGNNTEIQYNDGGAFAGDSTHTLNKTTKTVTADNIQLDTTPTTGAVNTGQMAWNTTDETLDIRLNSQVNMQIGQEEFIRVVNKTGVQINDGQVVRVSGAQGNRPTAVLAQANTFNSSVVIGVATQNIAINGEGFVTTHGVVNGFDTSVFSGAGAYLYLSSTTPGVLVDQITTPVPAMVTPVAVALNQTNNGAIFVSPFYPRSTDGTLAGDSNSYSPSEKAVKTYTDAKVSDAAYDQSAWDAVTTIAPSKNAVRDKINTMDTTILGKKYFHGVVQTGVISPLPTNLTTTTFTLAANTTPITYRYLGASITVNTSKTATLDDGLGGTSAGLYYVYFNAATGNILATKSFPGISDTSNVIIASVYWNGTDYGIVYDERHGHDRDHAWHQRAHDTIGCRYQSGLTFSFAGNVVANTTFALSTGTLHDEDIDFSVAGTTARIWYQTSATTYGFNTTLSTVPYLNNGTNIQSVNPTGYGLSTITSSNRYFNYFVYGSNSNTTPIHIFAETTTTVGGYTSVGAARAVAAPSLAGFGLAPEMKLLYRIVVNGPGNIQTPVAGDDYRTTSTVSGGALTTVAASGVTENNYGNVQLAIDTLLTMTGGSSDQSLAMIAM